MKYTLLFPILALAEARRSATVPTPPKKEGAREGRYCILSSWFFVCFFAECETYAQPILALVVKTLLL
jgi:hypothetical protein